MASTPSKELLYQQIVDTANSDYVSMAAFANRQAEISEWAYNDKMDTVFVLQVLFIGLVMISILFYANSLGYFGSAFAWYGTVLVGIITTTVILARISYTNARRDSRFWNRRKFDEDLSKLSRYDATNPGWWDYLSQAFRGFQPPKVCPENNCPTANATPATSPLMTPTASPAPSPAPV
jgi:hypothetical protein